MANPKPLTKWAEIRQLWKDANPSLQKATADEQVKQFWNKNKHDPDKIRLKIQELTFQKKNKPNPVAALYNKKIQKQLNNEEREMPEPSWPEQNSADEVSPSEQECPKQDKPQDPRPVKHTAHVQIALQKELDTVNEKIATLNEAKRLGVCDEDRISKKLKENLDKRKELVKALKKRRGNTIASRKARKKRSEALKDYVVSEKPNMSIIPFRSAGRPSLDTTQVGLSQTILDIVSRTCSADEKRRCETLRSNMPIKTLLAELRNLGYNISRQGLCLRFVPRNKSSTWGQRHHTTVNVKMAKATNSLKKDHPDTHFAAATVKHLKDLAVLFGHENVMVISVDDKAKVPLGLPAAKRQGPILMRMDYEIRLADHDWVVGTRHKLTPSVIAGLCVGENAVTYSGPTMISIRSGKHDSSTAESHSRDLRQFLSLKQFDYFTKRRDGRLKPILIMLVDGGPDENPRYPKTLVQAIQNFREFNFDAVFVACYAPHQSSSNPVERRMAPLSKDLVGIILPHDHFGNHLNGSGKTIDLELEIQNFDKAGHVLASLWSEKKIDSHKVVCQYVHPPMQTKCFCESNPLQHVSSDLDGSGLHSDDEENVEVDLDNNEELPARFSSPIALDDVSEKYKLIHVRQTQYTTQIVKCSNTSCCDPPETNLTHVLPEHFLLAPVLYKRTIKGIELAEKGDSEAHFLNLTSRIALNNIQIQNAPQPLPFDWFCPSVGDAVLERTCTVCGIYFPSKASLKSHQAYHTTRINRTSNIEVDETVDFIMEELVQETDDALLIDNLDEWFRPVFVEDFALTGAI